MLLDVLSAAAHFVNLHDLGCTIGGLIGDAIQAAL